MKQQRLRHHPTPSVKDSTPSVLQAIVRLQRQITQGGDPSVNINLLLQAICVHWEISKASLVDISHTPPAVLYTFPHPSEIPVLVPQTHPISLKRRAKTHLPHTVFDLCHKQGPPTVQLILEGSVPDYASDEIDVATSALDLALAWKKADPNDIGPLRRAFENSEDGFWEWDFQSGKVIFSDRDAEMLGYAQDEIPKRIENCMELYHPEDLARGQALLAEHAAGKLPMVDTRLRMRHKDGHWVWIRTRAKIVERDPVTGEPWRVVGADTDISKQVEMEDELEKLAFVVRNTTNIVLITDNDFRVEWVNDGFTRVSGYTLEEIKGRLAVEVGQGPVSSVDLIDPMYETLRRGEVFRAVIGGHGKQGNIYYTSFECRPIVDKYGRAQGYMAIGQDVTERKRAEEALAASEERLRLAFEVTQDAVWDYDVRTGRVVGTPRLSGMLGMPQTEFYHTFKQWIQNCHPDDIEGVKRSIREFSLNDRSVVGELKYRSRHQEGHYIWTHTRAKVVSWDTGGNPLRIVGATSDITREKQMEDDLEKLAMVVRTTTNAVVLRDRDFNVEWVNKAFEHLTGYTLEEVKGRYGFMFLEDPKGDPEMGRKLKARLQAGERVAGELRLRRKPGEYRMISFEAAPIVGGNGEIVGFMNIGQDITERVLAEEARLKMEERMMMSQRLESVGALAGGIAHDFNNILMGVLLEASVVREEVAEGTALWESLRTIEVSASRMKELVNQLLAFAGKGRFVVERVDPNALVKDTLSLISRNIHKDAELVVEMSPERAAIEIDPSQLRQVVMNLVINASDALEGRAGRISVVTAKTEKNWALWVEDTGKGISEEAKGRIFDPFYTTKEKGRGLGLSTVHGVVRRAKGEIEVDSKVGEGTIFRVRIPLSG